MDLTASSPWASVAFAWLVAFLSGSLPFSLWVGRIVTKRDVREVGDGNPGATNAFRAGGAWLGITVLLLDVTKGVLPVVVARDGLGLGGWALALVAVLAVAGAAFSPFLGFRGGKALAVTLGTWIGLTTWTIPLVAIVAIVAATLLIQPDAWAVAATLAAMFLGVLLWVPGGWPLGALLPQAAIILWKHRAELAQPPRRRRRGSRSP
ncbi:MAG: glycerol-3-phosphate acyltransferase [Trueperaceae bacterium]